MSDSEDVQRWLLFSSTIVVVCFSSIFIFVWLLVLVDFIKNRKTIENCYDTVSFYFNYAYTKTHETNETVACCKCILTKRYVTFITLITSLTLTFIAMGGCLLFEYLESDSESGLEVAYFIINLLCPFFFMLLLVPTKSVYSSSTLRKICSVLHLLGGVSLFVVIAAVNIIYYLIFIYLTIDDNFTDEHLAILALLVGLNFSAIIFFLIFNFVVKPKVFETIETDEKDKLDELANIDYRPHLHKVKKYNDDNNGVKSLTDYYEKDKEKIPAQKSSCKKYLIERDHDSEHLTELGVFTPKLKYFYRFRNFASVLSEWLAILVALLVYVATFYFKIHNGMIITLDGDPIDYIKYDD